MGPDYRERGHAATALPMGGPGSGAPAPAPSPVTAAPRPEGIPAGPWSPNAGPVGQTAPAASALPRQGHIGDPAPTGGVTPPAQQAPQEALPVSTAKPVKDKKGKKASFRSTTYEKFSKWGDAHRDAAYKSGDMDEIVATEKFILDTYHSRFMEHIQQARVQLWSGDSYGSAESLAKAYSYMPNGKQSVFQILDDGSIRANATDEKSGEKGRNVFTLKPQSRQTDRFFANMLMNFEDPDKFATWTLNRDQLDVNTAKILQEFGVQFDNADAANQAYGDIASASKSTNSRKIGAYGNTEFKENREAVGEWIADRPKQVEDPQTDKDAALAQYYATPEFGKRVEVGAANIMMVNNLDGKFLPPSVAGEISELLTAFDDTVRDKATQPDMQFAIEPLRENGQLVRIDGHLVVEHLGFKVMLPPSMGARLQKGYETHAAYKPPQVAPAPPQREVMGPPAASMGTQGVGGAMEAWQGSPGVQ